MRVWFVTVVPVAAPYLQKEKKCKREELRPQGRNSSTSCLAFDSRVDCLEVSTHSAKSCWKGGAKEFGMGRRVYSAVRPRGTTHSWPGQMRAQRRRQRPRCAITVIYNFLVRVAPAHLRRAPESYLRHHVRGHASSSAETVHRVASLAPAPRAVDASTPCDRRWKRGTRGGRFLVSFVPRVARRSARTCRLAGGAEGCV